MRRLTTACLCVRCFFCNNQWRILDGCASTSSGSDDLELVFKQRLSDIGNMVALVDKWDEPMYTKRIWTIYEQYVAIELDIEVQFTLPEGPATTLIEHLEQGGQGFREVVTAIAKVDAESAEASHEADLKKVKGMIDHSPGFPTVNKVVKNRIVEWVSKEFKIWVKELVQQHVTN